MTNTKFSTFVQSFRINLLLSKTLFLLLVIICFKSICDTTHRDCQFFFIQVSIIREWEGSEAADEFKAEQGESKRERRLLSAGGGSGSTVDGIREREGDEKAEEFKNEKGHSKQERADKRRVGKNKK